MAMLKELGILNALLGATKSYPLRDRRTTPLTRRRKRSKIKQINQEKVEK